VTDTPKRFPYGGGPARPARWVNPRLAAERGIEVAELPGEASVYVEPAFDEAVDDGSAYVAAEPGVELDDLDFEGDFGATADALDQARSGPSGADHLAQDVWAYEGWECDCKATAKTGIPPRHFRQYLGGARHPKRGTDYAIMILPGKGEIKQGKGEGNVVEVDDDGAPVERPDPVECPSWRPAVREWVRPERDWSKGKHGIKPLAPEPVELPPPAHPAGPLGEPEPATVADLPPRCTAKSLMLHAEMAHRVTGRMVDDGPIVTRFRLSGTVEGHRWVAYWTEGKFASARFGGRGVNLAELRSLLKGTTPTLL
jgi:hypothetical protein